MSTRGNAIGALDRRGLTTATAYLAWAGIVFLAVAFVLYYVVHYYLHYDSVSYDVFWPRRAGLLLHITSGTVALLVGPWQFYTGLRRRWPGVHRWSGRVFLVAVSFGVIGGVYLAITTTFGWAYGVGLGGLAAAWAGTTSMAYYAIRNGAIDIHKRWMIRAYVVTFGFVTYRLFDEWLPTANFKPDHDRFITEAWMCWALPLSLTVLIQAFRDVRRRRHGRALAG